MAFTVGLVALFGYYWLSLPLGAAVLLGAVVAPTDPVLATEVQTRHAGDPDRLRFALTCEAGINDGSAFPFVMLGLGLLGLHDLGDTGWRWLAVDVVWASGAGIGIGIFGGLWCWLDCPHHPQNVYALGVSGKLSWLGADRFCLRLQFVGGCLGLFGGIQCRSGACATRN